MTLQKSLVRTITGSKPLSHADPLFAKLGILKIDDLFKQRVRMFSYKLRKNMLPDGMTMLFDKVSHGHNTRGARSNLFVSRSDTRSIKYIAPNHWNALSEELKQSPSLGSFKHRSKVDLLAPCVAFSCGVRGCVSCAASALGCS